jgi:hypothetical protein
MARISFGYVAVRLLCLDFALAPARLPGTAAELAHTFAHGSFLLRSLAGRVAVHNQRLDAVSASASAAPIPATNRPNR